MKSHGRIFLCFLAGVLAFAMVSLPSAQAQTKNQDWFITVSGYVRECGNPFPGVTLMVNGISITDPIVTNEYGWYSFEAPTGSSFGVIPIMNGRVFTPASRTYQNVHNNYPDQNYDFGYEEFNPVANFPGVYNSSVAWGNYDNDDDGDLDIAICGATVPNNVPITRIYRNDGNSTFSFYTSLVGVRDGALAWGDYDLDGDLDLVVSGVTSSGDRITKIYKNTGNGNFVDINANLIGVQYSSLAWGDYDNDGDLDLAVSGYIPGGVNVAKIYRNIGDDIFLDSNVALSGRGIVSWGDYDNDGDLDLSLGCGPNGSSGLTLYKNNGNGNFSPAQLFPNMIVSAFDWSDYDNDGDLDLAVSGIYASQGPTVKIYKNNQGTFNDINADLQGVVGGSVVWGDHDNDGNPDLLLSGWTWSEVMTKVYRNNGNETFTDINADLTAVQYSSVAWGDYDDDTDLDLLVSGVSAGAGIPVCTLYRNNKNVFNSYPMVPGSGMTSLVNPAEHSVVLSWEDGSDQETPSEGLSYNLCVGTNPYTCNVVSPMTFMQGSASAALRLIPARGMIQKNSLSTASHEEDPAGIDGLSIGNSWTLRDLAPGTYYWKIQAIDSAFRGGMFAYGQPFTIPLRGSLRK